ncbi:alkaline phosphatase D family protein [Lacimicrobium sp. SS2-24]|uniref:alkaline phosphatase D family protein n=1 Tax=Lacimicrobium sp. SS2-24 TaxID=2005569 RepID=UPI000B4AC9C8|nr:alkaline phosphatase D family protein [Lacimicrobium sp. SS2-24]
MQNLKQTVLAGPILRHSSPTELNFWLVTSAACEIEFQLFLTPEQPLLKQTLGQPEHQQIPLGQHCFMHLLHIPVDHPLPEDTLLSYDLLLGKQRCPVSKMLSDLCYPGHNLPGFVLSSRIDNLLHGSCRKPHHSSEDGMLQVDHLIASSEQDLTQRPALLMLSGDQIYADDVAGPMLVAIHQLIDTLGLYDETWQGTKTNCSQKLYSDPHCYYQRESLLPADKASQKMLERLFTGASKPIFTASGAHNHLISFSEVIAMYLLVWSPECWQRIDLEAGENRIPTQHRARYRQEMAAIKAFSANLTSVRRALAHLPCYMIFDDHDVTDDWNLSRAWEESAYHHPFSKRIIGNALLAYFLCQGWGNKPENYSDLLTDTLPHFSEKGIGEHDQLIDKMLKWEHWHYHLDTTPKLIVLDTRTHRWRSESNAAKPSGLMDWESLSELQQQLIGENAVIMVSPAPVFGVKLIEVVQRIFTFFGKALLVDAENWMAHPGAANVLLNIFRHHKTPPHFVILSGDVHYSFVYNVTLRFRANSPEILQITSSGIKNTFPKGLLRWFDRLNRWLFASRSPLNYFTKRRRMRVKRRQPEGTDGVLLNQSGIGQVLLNDDYEKIRARVLSNKGVTEFR